MSFELSIFSTSIIQKQAVNEIIKCNDFTFNYGLVLTNQQAIELVETRSFVLKENGRIEFGGGVIDKIIKEFCDSPYISMHNYSEILNELIEMFYYYKNETLDLICDDDLIKFMKNSFDGICQGSLELLSGRELDKLASNLRYGYDPDFSEDDSSEEDEEDVIMNSIEKISLIDISKLNGKFYFQSLIEEAYRCNLLCEAEIERIQFECLELLAYKTERYNSGDSSSIRIEDAENIMISNLYTIGICLKSFQSVDDAIKELKGTKIRDIYNHGRNKIDTLLRSTNHIHKMVIQNMIHTENHTYSSTVIDGIKGFFKLYNPDFEAQEIHITADYPLCNQVENLAGIEFIQKYLECIYYENVFCSHFSTDNIHHMLCGYDIGYKDLVINIFELVLTTAIGCKLAGIDAVNLNISEDQINILYDLLYNKSKEDIEEIILKANENLQEELSINSILLKQYMKKSLSSIISVVCHAVKANTLEKVFIAQKYSELNPKLNFSFGDKMDDKLYRITIEEIMQCRFLSDKISIIKNSIHSLADLEELFFDAELSVDEITEVFKELELIELSALAEHHPFKPDTEAVYLSEAEQEFRLCLNNFIANLPLAKKNWILNTITMLDDNNKEI